jgi:dihydrofolate reductase
MNTSLDLYVDGAADGSEGGGGTWMRIGEELHREFNRRAREITVSVEGRVMHELMEQFWPAAIDDESLPDYLREYGEIWVSADKYMVSRTRTSAEHNTCIIGGDDAIDRIARIREETDGIVGVGGPNLATQLLHAGLLDEILTYTHPVILSTGRPLFDDLTERVECDLVEQASYADGVVLHRWAVRR